MAKRARVRPGQRRPAQRSARSASSASSRPTVAPASPAPALPLPAEGLTAEEEARAAALEAAIVAEPPAPNRLRSRRRDVPAEGANGAMSASSLAARYAHEYDYVDRDLKRIFALMGVLVGLLIAIWLVVVVILKA